MVFCYPKLSKFDFLLFRLGGPGLGNLLFPWARAKVLSLKYNYHFLSPTWPQFKLGPILRGELDNRNYAFVFNSLCGGVVGGKRLSKLIFGRRIKEDDHFSAIDNDVVIVEGMDNFFDDIILYNDYLLGELLNSLRYNRLNELEAFFNGSNSIAVHVRYGDFMAVDKEQSYNGADNRRLPIEYYSECISFLRNIFGDNIRVNIFSDAHDEELKPLLCLPNTTRVSGNTAIEDMLLMARHRVLIASGSTFSMWASFLGQVPTLWFPGQMRFKLVRETNREVEFCKENEILLLAFAEKLKSNISLTDRFD